MHKLILTNETSSIHSTLFSSPVNAYEEIYPNRTILFSIFFICALNISSMKIIFVLLGFLEDSTKTISAGRLYIFRDILFTFSVSVS